MKSKRLYTVWMLVLLFAALIFPCQSVYARNPSKVTLKANETYSSYDITGDGQADTIQITTNDPGAQRYPQYNSLSVSVNGVEEYSFSGQDFYLVTAELYTLKNGKNFLYLYTPYDNGDAYVCGVFRYKSGEFKEIINFNTVLKNYGSHCAGSVSEIKGNTITVKFSLMSNTTAYTEISYKYKYEKGTLKRSAKTSAVKVGYGRIKRLTVVKNFKIYSSPTAKNSSYTLNKGTKIKVTGAYIQSGKFCLKIKNLSTGKSGWIKCWKTFPSDGTPPFKEVGYAG